VALLGAATVALTANGWTIAGAAAIGFSCAGVLVLALTLPPLLCAPGDVARTSAAMFTISYSLAMVVAVISGVLWDATGIPSMAFAPIGLCAVLLLAMPATLPLARSKGGELR
jgi:CP family cyanate transporter-like MFS transporter